MFLRTCPVHGPLVKEECNVNKSGIRCKRCRRDQRSTAKGKKQASLHRKNHRKRHRQALLERGKLYYREHSEAMRASAREYQLRTKIEVLTHYAMGGEPKCAECDEREIQFLALDHVDGGGKSHCREIGGSGGYVYLWARKNDFPPIFQVLCHNCNYLKSVRPTKTYASRWRLDIKTQVMSLYSDGIAKCSKCHVTDIRLLTIDHINDDGAQDRKKLGLSGSNPFYQYLLRIPKRDDLQVLCQKHNLGKRCLSP